MKTLAQHVSLAGQFEEISATELRQQVGEALAAVALGKTFLITKNGKAVGILSKPPGETLAIEVMPDGSWRYGPV
jgi:hypothetical protein